MHVLVLELSDYVPDNYSHGVTIWAEVENKMHLNLCVNKFKASTGAS